MGPQRPNLVGLICWILIIGGFYGLVQALKTSGGADFVKSMAIYPYPPQVAIALLFGLQVLMVVTGICMYERQGWARYVYIVIVPVFLVHHYFGLGHAHTPAEAPKLLLHKAALGGAAALYLASIVILFMPSTRRYYHPPLYVDE